MDEGGEREMPRVLHVGCGSKTAAESASLFKEGWEETRLDIDPLVKPDIVASMTAMPMVPDDSFDAVLSCHNLEHLFEHEILTALREFRRVLKPGGFAFIIVPDILPAVQAIAAGRIDRPLYESPVGPVMPLDVIYGLRRAVAGGRPYMAHRHGFVLAGLRDALDQAGFTEGDVVCTSYDLVACAFKEFRPAYAPRRRGPVTPRPAPDPAPSSAGGR